MKKLLSLIVVVLLTVSMAFASDVRVNTMGGQGQIIKDVAGMNTYPQVILGYPNIMYANIDAGAQWLAGGNYALPVGTLGLIFKQGPNGQMTNPYFPAVPVNGGGASAIIDQKLDLVYGFNVGDMALGLGLSLYGNSYAKNYVKNTPNDKTETSASGLGLNLGGTFAKNLDAAIFFNMKSFTNNAADGKVITEGNGNTDFGLNARYWMEMSPKYVLVPHLMFGLFGEGKTDGAALASEGDKLVKSHMGLDIGLGNNMKFGDNVLAVADAGIQYHSATTTFTPKTGTEVKNIDGEMALPYFHLGLEGKVFSWMDFRMGATKVWASKSNENNDADTEDWGFVKTTMAIGAGFHFNALDIDAEIDPGFLTRGPNFVSGSAGDIATKVALTYTFDKK